MQEGCLFWPSNMFNLQVNAKKIQYIETTQCMEHFCVTHREPLWVSSKIGIPGKAGQSIFTSSTFFPPVPSGDRG